MMTTTTPSVRTRIPSRNIMLPPGKALFFTTDPNNPETKWDPTKPVWKGKIVWEGEARKKVEQMLGPLLPEFLEAKREELLAEARDKGDKIKEKAALEMTYETPWREVLSKETAEPTGEIEMVVKRDVFKSDRFTKQQVRNKPPLVVDAKLNPVTVSIPNGAIVQVKIATWPVFFAKDNAVGMKKLLETIQIKMMPEGRTPDTDGFETDDDGYTADADTQPTSNTPAGSDY